MPEIEFWFDFLSPYAFLAWKRAPRLLPSVRLRPRPVLLGPLLAHFGQLGPAEIPPKRAATIRDTLRRAASDGIEMTWPERHPFKSVLAARVALASGCAPAVIDTLFDAAWTRGEDLEDAAVVRGALSRAALDTSLVERAKSASEALRENTEAAVARGVFGVPTFDTGDELFFGDDQLPAIAKKLAGADPLDASLANRIIARPMGAVRAAAQKPTPPALPATDVAEMDPARAAEVAAVFAQTKFMTHLGVHVVRMRPGLVEAAMTVRPEHTQQDGFVHAGVQTSIADHAAGACAATLAGAGTGVLSIDFNVHLLRPARATQLFCRAVSLRAGRRVTVVESEVFDGPDASAPLASKATVTLAIVQRDTT